MLRLEDVTKSFGARKALDCVNFELQPGDVNVVCGPSGAGKTTLFRTIVGLDNPDVGRIFLNGCNVLGQSKTARETRKLVGTVFQSFNLFSHLTALDNVTLGPIRVTGIAPSVARSRALELLSEVGLAADAHKYPRQLSGGQQQRVAIARCLAMNPKLVLFDEPTSALDPERKYQVVKTLENLRKRDITILVITHDLDLAEAIAQRVFFMDAGRIVEEGTPANIFGKPVQSRTLAFIERHRSLKVAAMDREYEWHGGTSSPRPAQRLAN